MTGLGLHLNGILMNKTFSKNLLHASLTARQFEAHMMHCSGCDDIPALANTTFALRSLELWKECECYMAREPAQQKKALLQDRR